jgi:prophage antirepressor-like protein
MAFEESGNPLQLFEYDEYEVRTIMRGDVPWLVANDVCAVLEIADPRSAVQRLHPEDVAQAHVLDARGVSQQTNIVNESGFYDLVFRSDKPKAREFSRWVTSVVLPSLRRGDIYSSSEILLAHVQHLVHLEHQVRQQRQVVAEHGARLDSLEGNTGWKTALGFAKLRGARDTDTETLNLLGRAAGRLCRMRNIEPRRTPDQRFGTVGLYPEDILGEAWAQMGLK